MIKRLFYTLAACTLAMGFVAAGLAASPILDNASDRYPGSVRIADNAVDWQTLAQGALRWQSTYQTPDALYEVQHWYAARLRISPASDQYVTSGDGCAWLQGSDLALRLERTISVLLCSVAGGTRVVANESVQLWQ